MSKLGLSLHIGLILSLAGCPASDDGDTGANDESSSSSASSTMSTTDASATMTGNTMSTTTADPDTSTGDIDPSMCPGAGGAAADGDACAANADCASGVCVLFTDVPAPTDAVCGEAPGVVGDGCNTRITGTVFDFSTGMPFDGASLKVAGALNAITNPAGAMALASATSGADGRVDTTTEVPINQAIAIIALVEGPGAYLTATGLASPVEGSTYAVANAIHDLWVVPQTSVDAWTAALTGDPEVPKTSLPLGDAGGVVGLVRDATGTPIAGASVAGGADSAAVIRYVAADNTIDAAATATTETGIFVIVGAAQTGEDFTATMGGSELGGGTAGSANGAVFTLIINAG